MNQPWLPMAFAAVLTAVLAPGARAADPRYVAPPGLYDITSSTARGDGRGGLHGMPGEAPTRTCIPATKPGAIPEQMLAGGCTGQPGVVKGDGMVSVASCPWGKMTLTMRRVDARNWENVIEQERSGAGGKQDLRASTAPLMAMLRQQARSGTNAERAEAREALAGMEKEIREAEAALRANAESGDEETEAGPPVRTRTVIRMKRIAETCK